MDETWLALAQRAAGDAQCRRRLVGSVVVSAEGKFLAAGVNRLRSGSCLQGDCPRGLLSYEERAGLTDYAGNCEAVHAEIAADQAAGSWEDVRDATIYVTCEPCAWCFEHLRARPYARIVWPDGMEVCAVRVNVGRAVASPVL